jgi:hypothetical protein
MVIVLLWETAEVIVTLNIYIYIYVYTHTHTHKRHWIQLDNEELNNLYSSTKIIRGIKSIRMRSVGHVARMGEMTGADGVLVGKPEGMRPLGRPWHRWENNIKMDIQEVGWGYGLDCSGSG